MRSVIPGILHVEDNDLDAEKVVRALGRLGVVRPVVRARNGLEGLERLRESAPNGVPPVRQLVLLDLNMPCMNGLEFLESLRADPVLAPTPVFVLTTSGRDGDVAAAYRHHVAGYLLKAHTMDEMLETLRATSRFWDVSHVPRAAA